MKVEDTVMSEVEEVNGTTFLPPRSYSWEGHHSLMKEQAKITAKIMIKEVADWVDKNCGFEGEFNEYTVFSRWEWQAKLKEWGVEEVKDVPKQ